MAPSASRMRALVRANVAHRDRALRRLRRLTALIAAGAVLAAASVSVLAAATKPGTSKATVVDPVRAARRERNGSHISMFPPSPIRSRSGGASVSGPRRTSTAGCCRDCRAPYGP